ncbi:MAG TPA: Rne/Rng family ribonuclease, partial [Pyrinomonadaceae bacterium]|nr:Rne/Rng family ribonuclease [Pyrinomonadaceae bacterium]
ERTPERSPERGNERPSEPRSERGSERNYERPDRGNDRGNDRSSESRYSRSSESSSRSDRSDRSDYGPPPGYQPIILPGESISKYQRLAQAQGAAPARSRESVPSEPVKDPGIVSAFPDDEPLFSSAGASAEPAPAAEARAEQRDAAVVAPSDLPRFNERSGNRYEPMNVAATFGGDMTEVEEVEESEPDTADEEISYNRATPEPASRHDAQPISASASRAMEEEEIEEEEADLASYVEDLEEDATFEELEEETRAAEEHRDLVGQDLGSAGFAPGSEPLQSVLDVSEDTIDGTIEDVTDDAVSGVASDVAAEEDADEEGVEEAELDEAQAEAEALLAAEASGDGIQAEVRAPSGTAGFQRAARPGFDRRGGPQRGRRGGRRFRRREPQQVPQITDLLKEGQEILVQIAKEPIGKKGARITSHIALPGRFLVYMPTVNHTGVSRKISSDEERQRLKRIIQSERENGHGGFIVRTAAQGAAEEELRADIRFLKGLWAEIKSRADNGKAPALIYHDLNVVERVLRDQVTSDFSAIWVDSEQEYERILRFANRFQPALVRRVKLYTKETPLFEQFGLSEEMNKALKSKVWLKSGGYIVINQTEALVAIDVNTGKYVGKTARLEDTIVKTNVDAIKEIVRQIRLRDLGGIIVIDFIDMDERRNRQKVMQALEEALRHDRAPSKVLQFNDFGLVAITRKRVKQSLERTIGSPCPYCAATGFVKSVNTVCNEIYVEMRKISKHLDHADVMLRVNPEVAKALKATGGRWLTEMEELTRKTIIVKSDPALHQEQFDIT